MKAGNRYPATVPDIREQVAVFIQDVHQRLARRRKFKNCGPTNGELSEILARLTSDESLTRTLHYHAVDLLKLAGAIWLGEYRAARIKQVVKERDRLSATRKKTSQRERKRTHSGNEFTLTPEEQTRVVSQFSRRLRIHSLDNQLHHLTRYHPGLVGLTQRASGNRRNGKGPRQDLPVKSAMVELEKFLRRAHSNITASQRADWIRKTLAATGFDRPSLRTFQRKYARLMKQAPR